MTSVPRWSGSAFTEIMTRCNRSITTWAIWSWARSPYRCWRTAKWQCCWCAEAGGFSGCSALQCRSSPDTKTARRGGLVLREAYTLRPLACVQKDACASDTPIARGCSMPLG
jgi:hypothetical protein